MKNIIKIALALLILAVILILSQPIINKSKSTISNIEQLQTIEGIKKISIQSEENNITLKVLVENDLSQDEARYRVEEALKQIDVEDKKILFSVLYEHGYLIVQGRYKAGEDIKWD